MAAFEFLAEKTNHHRDVVPRSVLETAFVFGRVRVPLVGPEGIIFTLAVLRSGIPLSITTVPVVEGRVRPHEDEVDTNGFLRYHYRGTDARHHQDVGLRAAMVSQTPLIYFYGVVPGQCLAEWPVFVVGDDPAGLAFTVAVDDAQVLDSGLSISEEDDARRRYVTRLARERLHQVDFRQRVIGAYRDSCAVCRLRHVELLDAAHILPDGDPRSEPVVPNGLALCKLHHAAFDRHIIGVRPDLVVELREDILAEVDGPMLTHGLQGVHGLPLLIVPWANKQRPDPGFLAERYELFKRAG